MSARDDKTDRVRRLLEKAIAKLEAMTPDERAHHRHEQRISFAAGNVAMDWSALVVFNGEPRPALEVAHELARRAAGPCPCGDCAHLKKWRGHALARDADGVVRENEIATGAVFSGELEAR